MRPSGRAIDVRDGRVSPAYMGPDRAGKSPRRSLLMSHRATAKPIVPNTSMTTSPGWEPVSGCADDAGTNAGSELSWVCAGGVASGVIGDNDRSDVPLRLAAAFAVVGVFLGRFFCSERWRACEVTACRAWADVSPAAHAAPFADVDDRFGPTANAVGSGPVVCAVVVVVVLVGVAGGRNAGDNVTCSSTRGTGIVCVGAPAVADAPAGAIGSDKAALIAGPVPPHRSTAGIEGAASITVPWPVDGE